MLSQLWFQESLPRERPAVVTCETSTSWQALRDQTQSIVERNGGLRNRRVGLSFRPEPGSYASLAALDELACDTFLFDSRLPMDEALRRAEKLRLGAFVFPQSDGQKAELHVRELSAEEHWSGNSSITILTSGSTGEPKAARHSWESLLRPIRKATTQISPTWLLSYRPHLYAGLQVMLQCFADHGTLAAPNLDREPQAIAQFIQENKVEFVSATPSFWRRLLMLADPELLKKVPLKQITLGGEVVDQPLLDQLHRRYPNARLVHIFATTELGRCFSVSDGQAGFPSSYLDGVLPDKVELKVRDGELVVRSANSMRMYDPLSAQGAAAADWFATGDLVEVQGDRVFFVGRKSDMINVAGSKVYPIEVERVIRTVPGVSDVRVFGKLSSIAGELVACDILAECGQDLGLLKQNVIQTCRSQLTSYQQPRVIKFVDRIEMSGAGKTLRAKSA